MMVSHIKGVKVVGMIDQAGKCPCDKTLIIKEKDSNYTFIKDRGTAVFNNGETYIKCPNCGQFVMLPQKAA